MGVDLFNAKSVMASTGPLSVSIETHRMAIGLGNPSPRSDYSAVVDGSHSQLCYQDEWEAMKTAAVLSQSSFDLEASKVAAWGSWYTALADAAKAALRQLVNRSFPFTSYAHFHLGVGGINTGGPTCNGPTHNILLAEAGNPPAFNSAANTAWPNWYAAQDAKAKLTLRELFQHY